MAPQTGGQAADKPSQSKEQNGENRKKAYKNSNTLGSNKVWAWLGSAVLAVLAAILTFNLAPSQQVGVDRAIDRDRGLQDQETPPARVTGEPIFVRGYESLAFADNVSLPELALLEKDITDPAVTSRAHRIISADYNNPNETRSRQDIEFTLTGQHFAPVSVREISVRTVARREPSSGTIIWVHPEGGSDTGQVGFDLDSLDTRARALDVEGNPTRNRYFERKQVTLARDEHYTFSASVTTNMYDYDFVFDIKFSDGWVLTVDDGGKPWSISALASNYQRSYRADAIGGVKVTACTWPIDCRAPRY